MKPEVVFDVCHDVYVVAREALDGDLAASNLSSQAEYLWRPDVRPRLTEYVADFALAGRKALSAPALASRAALFTVYFVGGAEIQSARKHLGIGEITWAQWVDDVRTRVGVELLKREMFPPRDYFRKMSTRQRAA